MQPKRIELDVSRCSCCEELHETIKQAFDFPEYYGKNLDALWDCLRDVFAKEQLWEISISGMERMNEELWPYMQEVLKVFAQADREFPNVKVLLINKE